MIPEEEGYAEKQGKAYHQECFRQRFGKKCTRCHDILKGKVIKALGFFYHPNCFCCFQCQNILTKRFFQIQGKAVCKKCKQKALQKTKDKKIPEKIPKEKEKEEEEKQMTPIGFASALYPFQGQEEEETELSLLKGEKVTIFQKEEDGWWLVMKKDGTKGYIPGSYMVEIPIVSKPSTTTTSSTTSTSSSSTTSTTSTSSTSCRSCCSTSSSSCSSTSSSTSTPPSSFSSSFSFSSPGLCSECETQNPEFACFCRKCGNQLKEIPY
jgi:hypothetical protein